MTKNDPVRAHAHEAISRNGYLFVALWTAGILLFYGAVGFIGVEKMQVYRAETEKLRQTWLASPMAQPGATIPTITRSPAATPVAVSVLVNRVGDFSLRDGSWVADFDVSFRWKGDAIDPGATFRVVNGEIVHSRKMTARVRDGERYERYNVDARIEQRFDPTRFPFSGMGLVVEIEDAAHEVQTVRYEVAGRGIRLDPTVLGGRPLTKTFAGIKYFAYPLEGDTRSNAGGEVHSRFFFAMLVGRPGGEAYFKMFQALFASVGIALLVFFIKPIHVDPRFGLGVGAFFAAVGNNIFLTTLLPRSDRITLTFFVIFLGLMTIFLSLVQSAISLHVYETNGGQRLSRFFDRVSFAVFLGGYLAVNVLLPFASMS